MSKATIFEFSRQKSQRKSLENKRWDFIFDFQTMSSVEKLESEKLFSYRKSFISIFQMSLRFPRGLLFVRRTLFQKSNCCPKIQFWQKLYFQAYLNFSVQTGRYSRIFWKIRQKMEDWNSVFSVFLCCQGSLISLEFNYPRHIFLPFPSMSWSHTGPRPNLSNFGLLGHALRF